MSCFSSNIRGKNHSLSYICKVCKNFYNKEWYKKHRQEQINRAKIRNSKIVSENRELVDNYLLLHPCVDCEEKDIVVLDFDHVKGEKEYNISMMMSFNKNRLIKEILKCEVRCANCHRKRHAKILASIA